MLTSCSLALTLAYVIESFAYPDSFFLRVLLVNTASKNSPTPTVAMILPLDGKQYPYDR